MVCLLSVLAFVACSREQPKSANPEPESARESRPPAAPQPPDTRPAIVAFGDSLSAGFGADPGKSYPDFLQKEIDRRGYSYHVVNAGVSGDTTTDGLERIS